MCRNAINFLVDLATFVILFLMVATGLLLRFVLPPGFRGGRGLVLWGLERHGWGDIHFWLAASLGALVVVHVALHWSWVCGTVARMFRPSATPGTALSWRVRGSWACVTVAILAFVVFGFLWMSRSSVNHSNEGKGYYEGRERSGSPGGRTETKDGTDDHQDSGGGQAHDPESEWIRGSMTLQEVADRAGLSVDEVRRRLGLPAEVPAGEKLGRLRQTYALEMDAVRRSLSPKGRQGGSKPAGP